MTKQSWRYLGACLAAITMGGAALSCTSGGSTPAPTPTPTAAPTASATPTPTPTASATPGGISFSTQVQPIFTANCSTSGCHTGGAPSGGMDLTAGAAFASIKDRQTQGYGTLLRVKSGDPTNSVLLAKLLPDGQRTVGGRDVTGDGRMPLGRAPLSDAEINTIRTWITQGALNN